jgi:16S rRNA (guanine(527)-N(7))-methyltransferase RsmG
VTSREFKERLLARARRSNVIVKTEWLDPLERYFKLLARWNAKINLTALPLDDPTDMTFDRLLIEPLASSRFLINEPDTWWALGSGGGSPAIPMKISRPALNVIMVEAKTRKTAFLRESIRQLNLSGASVINRRFDELSELDPGYGSGRFATVRAVRTDRQLFGVVAKLLRPAGRLLLFRPTDRAISPPGFRYIESALLTDAPQTYVTVLERVFHVEQKPLTPS